MLKFDKPFIIFEMANNHQGSLEHGKKIIRELYEVSKNFDFDFAVKFQYRNLDTFIHPLYKDRMDLKFVKRFSDTRLSEEEFLLLKAECESYGFKTICTPFDEISVSKIVKHKYDFIKVASCSVKDWPLLEEIAKYDLPIISSSGGAKIEDVDKIVSFFSHKNKSFALMHCVGIYPTENKLLSLNRIDWFKQRYPNLTVGFSTHEVPGELMPAAIAVAKGAMIFEKHVGVETDEIELNAYSCTPKQVLNWLNTIKNSFEMCGVKTLDEHKIDQKELDGLKDLKRGVFSKKSLKKGEFFTKDDVFFAMPKGDFQMTSEEFSKHNLKFICGEDYEELFAITDFKIAEVDAKKHIAHILHKVKSQLNNAGIIINKESQIELSHHFGLENLNRYGAVLINCINCEEYCKKIIVLVENQTHPEHFHKIKKETFQILWGEMELIIDGVKKICLAGDIITIERGQKHSFSTKKGVIFEEVSTKSYENDSYYLNAEINKNKLRKTKLEEWQLRF